LERREVLVAVDASERSQKLVSFASVLAKDLGADVHLVYVSAVEPIPAEFKTYADQENVDRQGYNEAVGQAVLAKLEETARRADVECVTDLEHGNPAEAVVKYGADPRVMLVVVGLRGLHGVGRIRSLGSVARRVVENSSVPVVVVPT
jgi:nucleotide-binding universal stress UspA family protein